MNSAVKSASRVLDVLELFAAAPEALGVSEVAKRLEIPKSSAHALLLTLSGRGYLVRSGSGYVIPSELKGGWVGGIRTQLLGVVQPRMKRIALESGESVFIGVVANRGRVQFLAKAISAHELRYDASLDHLRPAHSTSIGLVILANMSESAADHHLKHSLRMPTSARPMADLRAIRQTLCAARIAGYVEARDANVEGASGVSTPVFAPNGEILAGLNLAAPSSRYTQCRERLIQIARHEADEITKALCLPRPSPSTS